MAEIKVDEDLMAPDPSADQFPDKIEDIPYDEPVEETIPDVADAKVEADVQEFEKAEMAAEEVKIHKTEFVQQKVGALTFAGIPMSSVRSIKPFINNLIYGLPGCGKTHLAATAADSIHCSPTLYINAEAGANTLLKFQSDNVMVIPDPEVQSGITWEQFVVVYDELDRQCYNSHDKPDFRTVTIDTGTELQKINMDYIMQKTMKAHPDRDPDVPGLHDWGASTNSMRKYLRLFRNLPMNFIFLCHETSDRDNKGIQWKKPDLPGKMANQVAGLFDQVMYLYTRELEKGDEQKATQITRLLLTGALEGYVTKDRSGNLPLVVANPNMNDIFNIIHS